VSHGEGRAEFAGDADRAGARIAPRDADGDGRPATAYPANPNGSAAAVAGLTSDGGPVAPLTPHPARTLATAHGSRAPAAWPDASPWLRMFRSARVAVG